MRKILIVGAGQSGLHLAHGLLTHGYDVTLITGQTSTEIRTGTPAFTQFTFPTVLEHEREFHLDFWSALAPHMEEFKLHLYPSQAPPMTLEGRQKGYVLSVDRRVKMADWLEYFEDRGGKVVIHGVTLSDLDYFSRMFDLIVVAVGSGELGGLFEPDTDRFRGTRTRVLGQVHIYDVTSDPGKNDQMGWIASTADYGNVFLVPILTSQGPCHSLLVMDKPGGPMDVWQDKPSAEEQLRRTKDLLHRYLPEYYERVRDGALVDAHSRLIGRVTPQVRNPVGELPSGGLALGLADVVVTSDVFGGQGWNNSTRCAKTYLEAILDRGDLPFDRPYLSGMFERYWEYGQYAEKWAETIATMWDYELPEHIQEVVGAAMRYPEVADRWVQGWDYPPDYEEWLFNPERAREYLAKVAAERS